MECFQVRRDGGSPDYAFGKVPNTELMRFLASATFGVHLEDCPNVVRGLTLDSSSAGVWENFLGSVVGESAEHLPQGGAMLEFPKSAGRL